MVSRCDLYPVVQEILHLKDDARNDLVKSVVSRFHDLLIRNADGEKRRVPNEGRSFRGGESLPHGLALNPKNAMLCMDDLRRVVAFVKGSCEAVRAALQDNPGVPVRFLEAGSGPLAPLAAAVASQFKPEQVRIALADFYPWSIETARSVFDQHRLSGHLDSTFVGDFTQVDFGGFKPDVIALETMDHALLIEPQAANFLALHKRFPSAQILPEEVHVDLEVHAPYEREGFTGELFVLSKEHLPPDDMRVGRAFELAKSYEDAAVSLRTRVLVLKGDELLGRAPVLLREGSSTITRSTDSRDLPSDAKTVLVGMTLGGSKDPWICFE